MKKEIRILDCEDVGDWVEKVFKSFQIDNFSGDFSKVETVGGLMDEINSTFELNNDLSCTTQRTFYQVRTALEKHCHCHISKLTPSSVLEELMPKKKRREIQNKINQELGINYLMLQPPKWITNFSSLMFISSFILVILLPLKGIALFFLALLIMKVSSVYGRELKSNNVRELVDDIVCENYLYMRGDWQVYNYSEIKPLLMRWINKDLGFSYEEVVTRATRII